MQRLLLFLEMCIRDSPTAYINAILGTAINKPKKPKILPNKDVYKRQMVEFGT